MSYQYQRDFPGDEEDRSPLLGAGKNYGATFNTSRGPEVHSSSQRGGVRVWSVVGISAAVIATVVIISTLSTGHSQSNSSKAELAAVTMKSAAKSSTTLTTYKSINEVEKKSLFEEFKTKFSKKYSSPTEEATRFANFKDFLALVDERNEAEATVNGKASHGITKFADMSQAEFSKGYLNYKKSTTTEKLAMKRTAKFTKASTTASVDWSGIYTTAVRNQGYCGSCWAFSATEQLESDAIREGLLTTSDMLSVQQVVSCDQIDLGCDGGTPIYAYYYAYSAGGLTSEVEYPYTSYWDVTGTCNLSQNDTLLVKPTVYYQLEDEDSMEAFVLSTGPLSVCLDATTWASYTGGIVSSCGMDVDHCVQAVGVDTENKYWKVRNSWGTDWGVEGYIYLSLGSNTCDITYESTFTTVVSSSSSSTSSKQAIKKDHDDGSVQDAKQAKNFRGESKSTIKTITEPITKPMTATANWPLVHASPVALPAPDTVEKALAAKKNLLVARAAAAAAGAATSAALMQGTASATSADVAARAAAAAIKQRME